MASDTVKLGDYLFTRLLQLGVTDIFGVPGDYNLRLLDYVVPAGLHWVGNCNELNAAYAADGYGRIKGLSALVTTFGVGELSAANGIAGAYGERSPVVHIVGTPPRPLQSTRALMHHTFSDGEYGRFSAMATHITAAQTKLIDTTTAPDKIDWILQQALIHQRPVYIEIPDDMPDLLVSSSNLKSSKISVPSVLSPPHESKVISRILERLYSAQRPFILVDGESRSLGILDQLDTLVQKTNWPTWTTVFGKGLINESHPNVYGLYAAAFGDKPAQEYFEAADLILTFGPHYSDTNSYFWTTVPKEAVAISFKDDTIQIESDTYRDMSASSVLAQILHALDTTRTIKATGPPKVEITTTDIQASDIIAQNNFYRLVNPIFRENDIVLAETGTASYGGRHCKLPPNSRFFTAVTWLSIGYMLPATLGAALAKRSLNQATGASNQTILITGEGSLQMTAQEISVMIKEKLNILIFIINNEGYTIERVIHGRKQAYNDVPFWRHTQALNYFGADEDQIANSVFTARTCGELQELLKNERVHSGTGLRLVEVAMYREDVQGPLLYLLNKQIAEEKEAAATS
jgi:pyruvate decarboxylase